jgi:ABC-type phosphate/phosphonate transport system ATPase subunit
MAAVSFEGVTKTYPDGTTAVNGLDLEITDSEFMVLVGPSGRRAAARRRHSAWWLDSKTSHAAS